MHDLTIFLTFSLVGEYCNLLLWIFESVQMHYTWTLPSLSSELRNERFCTFFSVANSLRSKMANVSEKNGQNGQSVFIAFLCDNFLVNVKIFEKNSKTF